MLAWTGRDNFGKTTSFEKKKEKRTRVRGATTIIIMVSLRFPFLFSQPPRKPPNSTPTNIPSHRSSFSATALTCSVAFAAGAGIAAISQYPNNNRPFLQNALNFFLSNFSPNNNNGPSSPPIWGSLSLSGNSPPVTESKTGVSFPSVLKDSQRLLGVGLRKKSVLGLKNIDVYAFGKPRFLLNIYNFITFDLFVCIDSGMHINSDSVE